MWQIILLSVGVIVNNYLKLYIANREKVVEKSGYLSKSREIKFDVSQDSI